MTFLFQLSLPFENVTKRTFYLFGCSVCNKSYRVIRQQSLEEHSDKLSFGNHSSLLKVEDTGKRNNNVYTKKSLFKTKKLFSDDEEEEEEEDNSNNSDNEKNSKKKQEEKQIADFGGKYLKFIREPPSKQFDHELELLERYNLEAKANGEDTFEFNSSIAGEGEDFYDRLQRQANQKARVCVNGKPLVPRRNKKDKKAASDCIPTVRKCDACGKERKFAFQLTPGCLDEVEETLKLPCDWATLLVYVCEGSCSLKLGNEYLEEVCIIVEEP